MISTFELIIGVAVGVTVTILIEEGIYRVIKRSAKAAKTNPTVIRDIRVAFRVIAVLAIVTVILSLTGLASEFTEITISAIGVCRFARFTDTLSNIISGILLFQGRCNSPK